MHNGLYKIRKHFAEKTKVALCTKDEVLAIPQKKRDRLQR